MSVEDFYNSLTPFYHLVYADWERSINRQAENLDAVITELWGDKTTNILDATCGVGTQALGLAQLGYRVTASDVSAKAVERAEREAAKRQCPIDFCVADVRDLSRFHGRNFDVVISCDNSLPHLLSDEEILQALREFHECLRPSGGLVISVRDYAAIEQQETRVVPYGIRIENDRRYLVFQVWEFSGPIYDLHMYFVEDHGSDHCNTHVMRTKYYAISTDRLTELVSQAGYEDVKRLDERFFQPLIVATRRRGQAAR